jgi:hypothetical protein
VNVRGVKSPLFLRFLPLVAIVAFSPTVHAAIVDKFASLGNDTYSMTSEAGTGLTRDTDGLKAHALDAAKAYCEKQGKELKVLSVTVKHPIVPFTGFAYAKVVFKALDANSPELHAPVTAAEAAGTPGAYAPAPAALPPSSATVALSDASAPGTNVGLYNDLLRLDDLHKRAVLSDEEFQAEKNATVSSSEVRRRLYPARCLVRCW